MKHLLLFLFLNSNLKSVISAFTVITYVSSGNVRFQCYTPNKELGVKDTVKTLTLITYICIYMYTCYLRVCMCMYIIIHKWKV